MSTVPQPQSAFLQEAIAAALAGDKAKAQRLLEDIALTYPDNELIWLWLASVVTTSQEVLRCWRHVLHLNPQHGQAAAGLRRLLWQEGIAAAKEGRKEEARTLLLELTTLESQHELAWLWLASLAQDVEEATRYTLRVLRINPNNERAQVWLEKLQPKTTQPTEQPTTPAATAASPSVPALPPSTAEPTTTGSYTILVVDDSPTIRKLVSMTLEKYGHHVMCAQNGLDALGALKEAIPDLILSDITMPQMDGYQLCKMIRSNAVTKAVPVIMLSGKDGLFDKLRGRVVGATAYITKPFEIDNLLQLIDLHCQQATQRI